MEKVEGWIYQEGQKVTASNMLQSRTKTVNASFAQGFNLLDIYSKLHELCPSMTRLLHAFSTTRRQLKTWTNKKEQQKQQASSLYNVEFYSHF